jgi:hypothetical protein
MVGQPLAALPLAFASHFVCDALPHFGSTKPHAIRTEGFRTYLIIEASLCFLIVLTLAVLQPTHWLLAAVCAFLAASPDLFWINRYWRARHGRKWRPSLFARFARGIQWFQRPIGAVVEVAWFATALIVLAPFVGR